MRADLPRGRRHLPPRAVGATEAANGVPSPPLGPLSLAHSKDPPGHRDHTHAASYGALGAPPAAERTSDRHLREMESNAARVPLLERRMAETGQTVEDTLSHCRRMDDDAVRQQSEVATLSQHLERITLALEREKARSAEHAEQIAYLTQRLGARRHAAAEAGDTSTMYWAVAAWLWLPVLSFFRGLFFVLQPVLRSVEHLAIFGGGARGRAGPYGSLFGDDADDAEGGAPQTPQLLLRPAPAEQVTAPAPFSLLRQLRSGRLTPAAAGRK